MKFGKLESVEQVDFTLPPDPQGTTTLLSKLPTPAEPLQVFVGCPAWSCKEWIGKYYPPKTKPTDFLHHYGKQFNTIELNTTHYRIPTFSTIEKWVNAVPNTFEFCPKIPQSISHRKFFQQTHEALIQFCESMRRMGKKLGISFIQLPPYFKPADRWALETFLEKFPKEIPLSIEFRHEDWFTDFTVFEDMAKWLEDRGVSTVITDVAGRRDVLHQRLTTDTLVLRLVGNNLHPTDFERTSYWVEKLADWHNQGLQSAYIFVHEPDDVHCPEFATDFIEKLNAKLNLQVQPPKPLLLGTQGSLF